MNFIFLGGGEWNLNLTQCVSEPWQGESQNAFLPQFSTDERITVCPSCTEQVFTGFWPTWANFPKNSEHLVGWLHTHCAGLKCPKKKGCLNEKRKDTKPVDPQLPHYHLRSSVWTRNNCGSSDQNSNWSPHGGKILAFFNKNYSVSAENERDSYQNIRTKNLCAHYKNIEAIKAK